MNFQLLLVTLLAFLGYNLEPTPARLNKKVTMREKINCWVYLHQYELLLLIGILVVAIFALVLFLAIGSCTDSGNVYNHMSEVI